MTPALDVDRLWLSVVQEVVNLAAHEVKDTLNGVSLNLEVIRSRSAPGSNAARPAGALAEFARSASDQLELLTIRTEALLFLTRPPRKPADVAVALRHLAMLLVPAAKADGGSLIIDGHELSRPTSASGQATRLALASGILTLLRAAKDGTSVICRLEKGDVPVVRFSHESACSFDPVIADAVASERILHQRSGSDLLITFPS